MIFMINIEWSNHNIKVFIDLIIKQLKNPLNVKFSLKNLRYYLACFEKIKQY